MTIPLEVLLRDSAYKLDQFKPAHFNALQAFITIKDAAKKLAPCVTCLARDNLRFLLRPPRLRPRASAP